MSKALFRIYYQNNPKCLSACPIMIHALLHIADSIEEAGPVWTSWAFPMERFCGWMQPAITSRCHPDACMAHYIVEHAQLTQAALVHGFTQELTLQPSRSGVIAGHFKHESCLFFCLSITPPLLISTPSPINRSIMYTLATMENDPVRVSHTLTDLQGTRHQV